MLIKEKLHIIFDMIIKNIPITTLTINNYGINSTEFIELLKKGIIEETDNNKYKIIDYKLLFDCGVALINKREFQQGLTYLEECYQKDKDNLDIKLYLLLAYINTNNIKKIEKILEILKNEITKQDFNLILYLLSIVSKCPDKYIEIVLNLKYEDLIILETNEQYNDIESQNTMRAYVIQNKFYYAKKIYHTKLIKNFKNRPIGKMIEDLLKEAMQLEDKRNKLIINCIELKDYNTIYNILEKKKQKMQLNLTDRLIYLITKDILVINRINKIPRPTISNTNKIERAIEGKNYYLALKIITEQNNVISDKFLKKAITDLLIDINKLIRKVYEEYKQKQTQNNDLTKTRKK